MKAYDVIRKMELHLQSSLYYSELAMAAQSSIGQSKEPQEQGPSLHTADNKGELDSELLPLQLKSSNLFKLVMAVLDNFDVPENGERRGEPTFNVSELTPASEIMSTQSIFFIFCLLEEYEISAYENKIKKDASRAVGSDTYSLKTILSKGVEGVLEDSINKEMREYRFQPCRKRIKSWGKLGCRSLPDKDIELYAEISDRRNRLTHESSPPPASRLEAVTFFIIARNLVKCIADIFDDKSIEDVNTNWNLFKEIEYSTHDDEVGDIERAIERINEI